MIRKRKGHDNNIPFRKIGSREVDGVLHQFNAANGLLKVDMKNGARINFNIVYAQVKNKENYGSLKGNIETLKEDLIQVMRKNGFKIPYEEKEW